MNIGGINSQIIFRENTGIYLSRREFLKTLGKELSKPFMLERLQMPTLRTSIRQRIIKLTGYTKTENEVPERSNIEHRPKCVFCPKRKNRKTMVRKYFYELIIIIILYISNHYLFEIIS